MLRASTLPCIREPQTILGAVSPAGSLVCAVLLPSTSACLELEVPEALEGFSSSKPVMVKTTISSSSLTSYMPSSISLLKTSTMTGRKTRCLSFSCEARRDSLKGGMDGKHEQCLSVWVERWTVRGPRAFTNTLACLLRCFRMQTF